MIIGPSSHLWKFTIQGTLEIFELSCHFAVNIFNLAIEIKPKDEVDIILKLQTNVGVSSFQSGYFGYKFLNQ